MIVILNFRHFIICEIRFREEFWHLGETNKKVALFPDEEYAILGTRPVFGSFKHVTWRHFARLVPSHFQRVGRALGPGELIVDDAPKRATFRVGCGAFCGHDFWRSQL